MPTPAPPTGVTATGSAAGVIVSWAANSEANLAGYHLYRSTSAGGPFTRVNATLLTTTSYDDTSAPGTTAFYRVTAVNTSGGESAPSTTVSATMPVANRIANPGFELDANNDTRPDRWTTNTRVTRSGLVERSESFAMRHSAPNNTSYTISQVVSGLTGGATYTFGGWTNIPATADVFTFTIQIQWRNASNNVLRTDVIGTYGSATAGWSKASGSRVSPTGTTNAQVQMVVSSLDATIYVDDFALR
jgi:hypothetical protein